MRRDARWRVLGGFALGVALVLAASLLATSMARIAIAEDADVQLKANEVLVFAWTADALLSQADFLATQVAAGQADPADAAAALEEVKVARAQYADAVADLQAVSGRGAAIKAIKAGEALDQAIEQLSVGSVTASPFASQQLRKVVEMADGERVNRAEQISASATQAGRVAVAARWLVAVILPGIAILAIRWNQRRMAERLRLEAELETERAVQASKTQFVNAVLHHLRTPMTSVLGFAETLRSERHRFNARQRNDMIETIAEQATDLGYLMEDLRVVSRADDQDVDVEVADCDLRRITETVLTGLEMQHVDYVSVAGYAEASADPKRLRQILRHLIANAREHRDEFVTITIGRDDECSWVEVADDGPGLPADMLTEVLASEGVRAAEADRNDLKVGVGLRLSERLAQLMHGSLEYERRDSTFSVFRLTLPAAVGEGDPTRMAQSGEVSTADLFDVLEQDDFEVVLQPIFMLTGDEFKTVEGFEALSRFRHGQPADWLKAAERSGMIVDFELATIRKAVGAAGNLVSGTYLALNVSTDTLLSSELLDACGGLDPKQVVFELSEDATVANYERTCAAVEQLVERGYRLALDDVGTGEMDMWHVVRLKPQIVKLDMSLIEAIDEPANLAIINGVVATASRIEATIIAEGIETREQLEEVKRLGIHAGQGFYLGEPSKPADQDLNVRRWDEVSTQIELDVSREKTPKPDDKRRP